MCQRQADVGIWAQQGLALQKSTHMHLFGPQVFWKLEVNKSMEGHSQSETQGPVGPVAILLKGVIP